MMDYIVIEAQTAGLLSIAVKQHIKDGWVPQGSVSVTNESEYHKILGGITIEKQVFRQAMIKGG